MKCYFCKPNYFNALFKLIFVRINKKWKYMNNFYFLFFHYY